MLGRILQTLSILTTAILVVSQGKPDVPLPVHGITDRSVNLILPVKGTSPIREIYWIFQTFILAHYLNNHLDVKYEEFDNRLEILDNGTTLRINNLRKEDGGTYSTTVHFTDKKQNSTSYILTVYDPVPSPVIRTVWEEDTTDRCNVTLNCSVPSHTSDLSYTWESRHQNSTYQWYSNGSTIQISLLPDHEDLEFLCIVQNPADQKNDSINVRRDCFHPNTIRGSKGDGRHSFMLLLIPLVALTGISVWFLLKRYNKKGKAENNRRKVESEEMAEIHYADLALGTKSYEQRSGSKNEEHNTETVYSAVVS